MPKVILQASRFEKGSHPAVVPWNFEALKAPSCWIWDNPPWLAFLPVPKYISNLFMHNLPKSYWIEISVAKRLCWLNNVLWGDLFFIALHPTSTVTNRPRNHTVYKPTLKSLKASVFSSLKSFPSQPQFQTNALPQQILYPRKLTWIPKMMVWRRWFLLNMAIFGMLNFWGVRILPLKLNLANQATEVWDNCKSRDQEP